MGEGWQIDFMPKPRPYLRNDPALGKDHMQPRKAYGDLLVRALQMNSEGGAGTEAEGGGKPKSAQRKEDLAEQR